MAGPAMAPLVMACGIPGMTKNQFPWFIRNILYIYVFNFSPQHSRNDGQLVLVLGPDLLFENDHCVVLRFDR